MATEPPGPSGILLLDKPSGMSSNAALQRVRWLLGRPKAGHTGSLDPLATGMLPVCVGEATKVAGALLAGAKGYTVTIGLGARTDSGDSTGTVVERQPVPPIDAATLAAALEPMRGRQLQVPPMYSALKQGGQPLYRLARKGLEVERAPRKIEVHALEVLEFGTDSLRLRIECSKGTYVRTLAEQLGTRLGTCAHVTALRRDFVAPFRGEPMHTLEELLRMEGPWPLLGADRAVAHLPEVRLTPGQARALAYGQTTDLDAALTGPVRLYAADGCFMGLGSVSGDGVLRPLRLFAQGAGAQP